MTHTPNVRVLKYYLVFINLLESPNVRVLIAKELTQQTFLLMFWHLLTKENAAMDNIFGYL